MALDPKSFGSLHLSLYLGAADAGSATGFCVVAEDTTFLLTNYHVVSGRHPDTHHQLDAYTPDRILIALPWKQTWGPGDPVIPLWSAHVQHLFDENYEPLWVEHPTAGSAFDVVALPLSIPEHASVNPYSLDPGPQFAVLMSSDVAVIGFPDGMAGADITAIWKTGHIASEPDLLVDGKNFFWIDSNTRPGMSGSPVIARRFGTALNERGDVHVGGLQDRTLGVYAGRAYDAPDMTMGRVWRFSGVRELLEAAARRVAAGTLSPRVGTLYHYVEPGASMVRIEPKSVSYSIGGAAPLTENVYTILKLFAQDGTFGRTIATLRIAAQIVAAAQAAEARQTAVELTDDQFDLLKQAIEAPKTINYGTGAVNLLPVLEHILAAKT